MLTKEQQDIEAIKLSYHHLKLARGPENSAKWYKERLKDLKRKVNSFNGEYRHTFKVVAKQQFSRCHKLYDMQGVLGKKYE